MAVGVAVQLQSSCTAPAPVRSVAPLGISQVQVGHVVQAQPVYTSHGTYGGSFCGPSGPRNSGIIPVTSYAGTQSVPVAQPVQIRRLSSQNSTASLSLQPVVTTSMQPPIATQVQMLPRGVGGSGVYSGVSAVASGGSGVFSGPIVVDGLASLGASVMPIDTPVVRTGCSPEILEAEAESLRRNVAAQEAFSGVQEDRISQLTKQLQTSHDNERKLAVDLEASRSEVLRLREEVRLERLMREQAEGSNAELQMASDMAQGQDRLGSRNVGATPGRPRMMSNNSERMSSRGNTKEVTYERSPTPTTPLDRDRPMGAAGGPSSSRRGSASGRPQSAKDEIDGRLHEFLERSDCGLVFRRLNRGWYSFRIKGERGPTSSDRSVEISIVNGKLMAKLEPSTHDNGWNNGKLGPVERFVAAMSL